jgi:hypothetical protein
VYKRDEATREGKYSFNQEAGTIATRIMEWNSGDPQLRTPKPKTRTSRGKKAKGAEKEDGSL